MFEKITKCFCVRQKSWPSCVIIVMQGGLFYEKEHHSEKDLRRIVIHLSGMESSELVVYGSFHDLIPNLDERFLYCHRSYIINMDEIIIMSHNQILLSSNEGIYFGKDTYRKAQKTFEEYMQRKRKEFS